MSIANPDVTASPDKPSERLADTTMMLVLMTASKDRRAGTALSDRTLGLIGFGQVGQAVARRARHGFGMRVLMHSLSAADRTIAERLGVEWVDSIDALLPEADFVSLHCHGSAENHHVIDAHRLNQMKPNAFLINTAHGEAIDEHALMHALWFETIGGAGFAVSPNELQNLSQLRSCDNAIVLPQPRDTVPRTHETAGSGMIDNVVDFFEGRRPRDLI